MSKRTVSSEGNLLKMIQVARQTRDIWKGDDSMLRLISKAVKEASEPLSNQGISSGRRRHLIDKGAARDMQNFNPHHAAALASKVNSSVGQGHRDEEIADVLDPLCQFSWQDVLESSTLDLCEGGDGYIEVVREGPQEGAPIVGLFHLDGSQVYVNIEEEDNGRDFHYVVQGERVFGGETVTMAKFGELPELLKRYGQGTRSRGRPAAPARRNRRTTSSLEGEIVHSEIIHFRLPTNRSRYYGFPDYLSAVPSIELVQCMTQERFDFFFNRGVPEFLAFLIGRNISPETWRQFQAMMRGQQGIGNLHKSGAIQIPSSKDDVMVQIEKLALEGRDGTEFTNDSITLAMNIVTAHQIPPLLAGVQIPGKMGGNNEGPNALMLFQKQKIGRLQRLVSATLAATIGSEDTKLAQPDGAEKALKRDQFLGKGFEGPQDKDGMPQHAMPGNGFRTVLDGLTLGAMETLSTMKEPLVGSDRNPEDGKLGSQTQRKPSDPRGRGARGGSSRPKPA